MNAADAGSDSLIGKVVQGRFQVERRLAAGGMGVVYKAIQQPLGRPVAFKVLELATGTMDATFQQRFFLEASAAAKLAHPNTIVVHDYGRTDEGQYFIAMEFLGGGSLAERLHEKGPLNPLEAVHVGLQIVSSLRDAHEQGLVHRDLKPGNVMFAPRGGDPLFVKVLDFGLVKVVGEGPDNLGLTQSGVMMGSPRYMAPEQVKAQPVDSRTDIYSFGAVLYHVLTGAPPFAAGSAFEAMNHAVYTPAPPLRQTWPYCPASPELEAIVMRCLAKEPAERYQSMDEVLNALRAVHVAEAGGGSLSSSYLMGPSGQYSTVDRGSESSPSFVRSAVGSAPQLRPPSAQTPQAQAGVGHEPSRAYNKTVRFDGAPELPPPSETYAPPLAPARSSGAGLKIAVALVLILGAAAAAAAAAILIPVGEIAGGVMDAEAEVSAPADPEEPAAPDPVPPPGPAAPLPVAEAPAEPAPVAAPATVSPLLLRTDPPGATVRRNGDDLGDTPLPLLIAPGVRWTLDISRAGHEPRRVVVAGGQPELLVHLTPLEPAPARGRAARRAPAPAPQPQVRSLAPAPARAPRRSRVYAPDLDDPWANQRR